MRLGEELEERTTVLLRRAGLSHVPMRVVGTLVVLSVAAALWAGWRWWPRTGGNAHSGGGIVLESATVEPSATISPGQAESSTVLVHVVGAVRRPGVYTLPAGARAADAVELAGGLMPDAVVEAVNLARPVTDGEQIAVPDEDSAPAPAPAGAESVAGVGSAGAPVDLNSADATALDALPGVGPATARRIIADREANGPFASVEDLGRVSGIGPKKLEQLQGLVCVR